MFISGELIGKNGEMENWNSYGSNYREGFSPVVYKFDGGYSLYRKTEKYIYPQVDIVMLGA